MLSGEEARDILYASLCFHELFKKTIYEATPPPLATKTQVNVAVTLLAHAPMNMSALSSRTGIAPEQATRAVKALREKGLVDCNKSPENRREVIVRLSEEGSSMMRKHLDDSVVFLESYLGRLDDDDVSELIGASQKAIALFEKIGFSPSMPKADPAATSRPLADKARPS